MNNEIRTKVLKRCKNGESCSFHKSGLKWTLGKPLWFGVTPTGFPWMAFETTNFGTVVVGVSRTGQEPVCKIRNDASCAIMLNTCQEAEITADKMSRQLINREK